MHPAGLCAASLGSLGLLRLLGAPWGWSAAAALGLCLGGGGWRLLRLVVRTAPRDLFGLWVLLRVRHNLRRFRRSGCTIPSLFQATARRLPDKAALVDEASGLSWTFRRLDEFSDAVAAAFRARGFGSGRRGGRVHGGAARVRGALAGPGQGGRRGRAAQLQRARGRAAALPGLCRGQGYRLRGRAGHSRVRGGRAPGAAHGEVLLGGPRSRGRPRGGPRPWSRSWKEPPKSPLETAPGRAWMTGCSTSTPRAPPACQGGHRGAQQ
ncbi:uncharacterized protein LOC125321067, partial [Corvus hawaiiensis]|uniref:uncharacterized protein LOC125321067 n=1 Tax=Corvus hawaiiensis TaxID=134902 RepID=UPI002018D64E